MRLAVMIFVCWTALAEGVRAAEPASQPADPTMNWLLSGATTAPVTTAPSTQPGQADDAPATLPSVLSAGGPAVDVGRAGEITLSNGEVVKGQLSTTLRQPLHVWVEEKQNFEDVPFSRIKSIEARVVWERQEPEWNFAESGRDTKVYSGKTYPNRMTDYVLTLKDGTSVTGAVAAPIYVDEGQTRHIYILHKRDKGEVGQGLGELVYVKRIQFAD